MCKNCVLYNTNHGRVGSHMSLLKYLKLQSIESFVHDSFNEHHKLLQDCSLIIKTGISESTSREGILRTLTIRILKSREYKIMFSLFFLTTILLFTFSFFSENIYSKIVPFPMLIGLIYYSYYSLNTSRKLAQKIYNRELKKPAEAG